MSDLHATETQRPETALGRASLWWRTLSARIVLLFAGLFLLVMGVVQVVGVYGLAPFKLDGWIRQLTREELRQLSAAADASKNGIEAWIRERRNDVLVISRQPSVRSFLREIDSRPPPFAPEMAMRAAQASGVTEQLALIHDAYGSYESVAVIEARGGRIVASSDSTAVGNIMVRADMLATVIARGVEETLLITNDGPSSRPLLKIFRHIPDPATDRVLGLMVFSIDLESELRNQLHGMLTELHGATGEVLLYDAQSRFVLQPRHALSDGRRPQPLADKDDSRLAQLAGQGGEGQIATTDYRGESVFAAYRYIRLSPEIGWGLVVKKDDHEVLASLRQHNRVALILTAFGMIAFLGTAILSARWITRPIRTMMGAARRIEAGNLDARADIRGDTEIADLARTFNAMAQRVSDWHVALDAQVNQQTSRIIEQEGTLVTYIQTTNDAIITIDEHGCIAAWNPAAERTFGYSAGDAVGQDLHRLLTPPHLLERAASGLRRYLETGEGDSLNKVRELPALTRSGKSIIIELTVSPIMVNGRRRAIGTLRDISERRRLDTAMRVLGERLAMSAGEDYFKSLAKALGEAIEADFVEIGELLPASPRQLAMLGGATPDGLGSNQRYSLAGTPGERILDGGRSFYANDVLQDFPSDARLAAMGVRAYLGQALVDKSGHPIGLIAAQWREPLADSRQSQSILKLFASRAGAELERMLAQRELASTLENLEGMVQARTRELTQTNLDLAKTVSTLTQARRELVEAEKLASLGRLVAGIAHELNTPIGNSLMVSTALSEKIHHFHEAIAGGSVRRSTLNELASDLDQGAQLLASGLGQAAALIHDFKQVAVDQTSSQRRPFDLRTVIEEVGGLLHARLKNTRHQLVIAVPPDLRLDSFPGPLGQVINNLVDNALIHAFEGRECGTIRIDARLLGPGQIELLFSDDGCGMEPEVKERIFDPFFTTRMGRGGSGLGMHIVYNIVTGILGGKILVLSEPGSGTRFLLTLPDTAPTNVVVTD